MTNETRLSLVYRKRAHVAQVSRLQVTVGAYIRIALHKYCTHQKHAKKPLLPVSKKNVSAITNM